MNKRDILLGLFIFLSVIITAFAWSGLKKQTNKKPEVVITIEPAKSDTVIPVEIIELKDLGEFKLTAYCSCSKCCGKWAENRDNGIVVGATGEELIAGYSIAVDPNVIPYGTVVLINGQEYKAMDCGGAIKGNRIDVYFSNHSDAVNFGVKTADVMTKNIGGK